MKATLTYEGKTVEVEIAEEEARKIFAEPKKTGWERVEIGEYYRCIHISTDTEDGTRADDDRYQEGRYISSYALAFDQIRAIKLWLRIKRWAAEHCEPVAFKPEAGRWRQKYGIQWELLGVDGEYEIRPAIQDSTRQFGNVYLDTKEHAELGLCRICGKQVVDGYSYCLEHLEKAREKAARMWSSRKAKEAIERKKRHESAITQSAAARKEAAKR